MSNVSVGKPNIVGPANTQMWPFRSWLAAQGISPATGYRLLKERKLTVVKLRRRTYITMTAAAKFIESLECGVAA